MITPFPSSSSAKHITFLSLIRILEIKIEQSVISVKSKFCSSFLSCSGHLYSLLYHGRMSVCRQALSKFLKCVNWEQNSESQQALELMSRWAPIDPNQALELLGPTFTHPAVRTYAISRLLQAPDEVGTADVPSNPGGLEGQHCAMRDLF